MTMKDIADVADHKHILLRDDPDSGYEYFWLNFKHSVTNITQYPEATKELHELAAQVDDLTLQFNKWKASAEYNKIGSAIEQFLMKFFWHVFVMNRYQLDIALTNLKRWNTCCELRIKYPVPGISPLDNSSMNFLYFLHRCAAVGAHDLIKRYVRGHILEDAYGQEILSSLFDLAIKERKCGLVEKFLNHYPDWIYNRFLLDYNIELPKGIKNGAKTLRYLDKQQ